MGEESDDLVKRLRWADFGTETSERNLMIAAAVRIETQAARIAELEAAVRTLKAERDQLIGALQIAIERSGDIEHPPAWVDAACDLLNQGFLKVDRAALEGEWDGST